MRTDEIYALMLTFHLQNIKKKNENGIKGKLARVFQ